MISKLDKVTRTRFLGKYQKIALSFSCDKFLGLHRAPKYRDISAAISFVQPIRPLTKRNRDGGLNFASEVNSGEELNTAIKSLGGE